MPVASSRIVPYSPEYREAFFELNAAWVRKYFTFEAMDEKILGDPETHVLAGGGEIYMAVTDEGTAIGAVAMKKVSEGRYELTKLGVNPAWQGSGAGRALTQKVIERFLELRQPGDILFLETNDKLTPAISLYWKLGFVEKPFPEPSPYARANYYMEWVG